MFSATRDVLFAFNVGFVTFAVLAPVFLALSAPVQYGCGIGLETRSGSLVRAEGTLSPGMRILAFAGPVYLVGFTALLVLIPVGIVG